MRLTYLFESNKSRITISEVLTWQNNILYAFDGSNLTFHNEKEQGPLEHPDAFPHLDFMGRESNSGPRKWKPKAKAWGRIDTNNQNFHIVTQNGMQLYDGANVRELTLDIENRLSVLDAMEKQFPNLKVHVGGISGKKSPEHFMTIGQYKEFLMGKFPAEV